MAVKNEAPYLDTVPSRPLGMTRERYVILALLFLATFMNYMDRVALSVTKSDIQAEIGASDAQMGFLMSAFAWSITLVIIVFGWLSQRFGARKLGAIGLGGFSLMTLLTPLAGSFAGLSFFRFGLGVFEAPTFPLNSNLARNWFPRSQRAKAVSIYMIGSFFGMAFAMPLLGWIQGLFGTWHAVFVACGLIGLIIGAVWWYRVRNNPAESPHVSIKELELIHSEPEPPTIVDPPKPNAQDWRSVFFERRLIGLYLGAFGTSTVIFFFITWFPDYLKTNLGFDFKSSGALLAALPYLCGMAGMFFAGWFSDRLIKRGMPGGRARKFAVTIGLSGVVLVFLMLAVTNHVLIMTILCVVFFFAGMANTAWLLTAEISKPRLLGLTTGVYGFWVNLFGALTPLVVGIILDKTGASYAAVFSYVGAAALIGALGYVVLIDKVEPQLDRRFA